MAFIIVQSGSTLNLMSTSGSSSTLTLPTGVTVDSTLRPRFAVMNRYVVIANSPSRPITVDPFGTVRVLSPTAPSTPVALSAVSGGTLSGTFQVKTTYIVVDAGGNLIAESYFSPASAASPALSTQALKAANLPISTDSISALRLYRTATGPGTAYFKWLDIDGNTQTSIQDDLSDAGLAIVAAPTDLGSAPNLSLLCQWRDRLWGVGKTNIDLLAFTAPSKMWAWPTSQTLNVAPVGGDQFGITGLIPRRDELGVAKRNILWKVVGTTASNFSLVKVIEGKGCWSPESIVVIRDIAYFLGEDGVYTWGPDGVTCISDEKVRGWFATDAYFNRAQYQNAFAKYNPKYHSYELHLASAGSSNIDRWVSYDINRKIWFGPHQTAAFTPTCAGIFVDSNNLNVPVIGSSSGFVMQQNQTAYNDASSAITVDLVSKFHSGDTPDITKVWGRTSVLSKIQAATGNLSVVASIGGLDATTTTTLSPDLTLGRQRFQNLGIGRLCQLEFTESTLNQGCELYGYELPYTEVGRR